MSFYKNLSKYYDVVFKTGENQLKFIKKYMGDRKSILDIAAGTGNYSIELQKSGYKVDSLELDPHMVKKLEEKLVNEKENMNVFEMSMTDIDLIDKTYDGMYCIGNSIVHLNSHEEIKKFLKKAYEKLNRDGVMIIQIVNYDRVLKYNVTQLPTIVREEEKVSFKREYLKEGDLVIFRGILDTIEGQFVSEVNLFILTKDNLEKLLIETGFNNVKFFGGFDESQYNYESFGNVCVAYK